MKEAQRSADLKKRVDLQDAIENLSDREREVLLRLSYGLHFKDIAELLFISIETVRTNIRNVYEKLHAENKKDTLRKAGLN